MKKTDLLPGREYLHRRRTVIAGITRTAERWMQCEQIRRVTAEEYLKDKIGGDADEQLLHGRLP